MEVCPRCGRAVEPDQEYCLECGSRLFLPKRPLHWIWPSLAALVVAAAGTAAVIETDRAGAGGGSTIVALTPLRSSEAPPASTSGGTPLQRKVPLLRWHRTSAYTIVLSTIPVGAGLDAATAHAREALRAGLSDVGVLESGSYASLHPGYYVVFAGVYDSAEEAQGTLPRAKAHFPSADVRWIAR